MSEYLIFIGNYLNIVRIYGADENVRIRSVLSDDTSFSGREFSG